MPAPAFGGDMLRREFIAGLAGAATLSVAARAQQVIPVIGFLHGGSATGLINLQVAAFRQGLKDGGFTEGQNLLIEYRWSDGQNERLPELATDLVRRNVSVIATVGGPASNIAAKNETSTIPVVFNTGADPVKTGIVSNLRRPGGNVTGVTFLGEELNAKALVRELSRGCDHVGRVGEILWPHVERPVSGYPSAQSGACHDITVHIQNAPHRPDEANRASQHRRGVQGSFGHSDDRERRRFPRGVERGVEGYRDDRGIARTRMLGQQFNDGRGR